MLPYQALTAFVRRKQVLRSQIVISKQRAIKAWCPQNVTLVFAENNFLVPADVLKVFALLRTTPLSQLNL